MFPYRTFVGDPKRPKKPKPKITEPKNPKNPKIPKNTQKPKPQPCNSFVFTSPPYLICELLRIQAYAKMLHARKRYQRVRIAVAKLQSIYHGWDPRMRLHKMGTTFPLWNS